jgi:hypothetical protein
MNFNLSNQDRLDLKRLLNSMECDNNTELIRKVKHSTKIQQDVMDLVTWMKANPRQDEQNLVDLDYETEAKVHAQFLQETYPDLFKKVLRNEISFAILDKLLQVLKGIEDGKVDQHEGSVLVGKVLKELYLDSAVRHGDNLDKKYETSKPETVPEKQVTWKQYKTIPR